MTNHHISASQIQSYRRCNRLIGFEYVEELRPPSTQKQSFGSAVHAQLESWLKDGKAPDDTPAGNVAAQGIRKDWLPTPSKDLLVEHPFELEWRSDIRVIGFVDCASPPDRLIIDHKTTSSLQWAMTEDKLRRDPQALIYASWAALEWDVSEITARWVYYAASNPKNGPRRPSGGKPVQVTFDFTTIEVKALLEELDRDINEVYTIKAKAVPGKDLTPNPAGCSAYGGCPHRDRCDLSPGDTLAAYLSSCIS